MDHLVLTLQEAKEATGYKGKSDLFKRSKDLVQYCVKHQRIIAISHPSEMESEYYKDYFDHLVQLTCQEVGRMSGITHIDEIKSRKDCRKAFHILWEFGVIGEIRNKYEGRLQAPQKERERSATSITIRELYEVAKALLHFSGSELAFKRQIQRLYGSFAEYCIVKGYDINSTKWENDETAMRVARKLGSIEAVKARSNSLYHYLLERDLIKETFKRKIA